MRQGWFTTEETVLVVAEVNAELRLPSGFSILTQTCDLDRNRGEIQVVAHVELSADEIGQKGGGKSPQFQIVSSTIYADFDKVWTVKFSSIETVSLYALSLDDEAKFRAAAGRKYGRIAIPTHVGKALSKLRNYMVKRAKNSSTEAGAMVALIREIRVGIAPDWGEESEKSSVELTLILDDAEFPFDDEWSESSALESVKNSIASLDATSEPLAALTSLSGQLNSSAPGTPERTVIWDAIGRQLAALVADDVSKSTPPIDTLLIGVATKSRFSLNDIEATERLDLAHLSTDDE